MFIIDVQGFQYKNSDFLCREIAIININADKMYHKYVQLPIDLGCLSESFCKHIEWTTRNIHGLLWDDEFSSWGDEDSASIPSNYIPLERIALYIRKIIKPHDKIFVKGYEKKRWLSKLICNEIVDLLELGCDDLASLKASNNVTCKNHNLHCNRDHNLLCARENVFLLKNWYNKL